MKLLITYDVETITKEGQKRLRLVAKACKDYGQRVQNSVFECDVDESQFVLLKHKLECIIDKESDSIRIYHLKNNSQQSTIINVSSTNSEQCKLCVNGPLYIDTRLLWKQTIGSNGP